MQMQLHHVSPWVRQAAQAAAVLTLVAPSNADKRPSVHLRHILHDQIACTSGASVCVRICSKSLTLIYTHLYTIDAVLWTSLTADRSRC